MFMKNNWVFSLPNAVAFCAVMALWLGWIFVFLLKKKGPQSEVKETRRERGSIAGIALQGVSYAAIWMIQRRPKGPLVPMPDLAQWVVAALQILLAGFSVWLSATAVRTLGKQWTYVARTIEGHELITQGPYRLVRNPIYLGMFGMMVATAVSVTIWPVLLAAVAIFLTGTAVRIRNEEKVLRATFGTQFEDYARRVPAFLPGLF
jgi:protein-S-isoprenylcysteine O-methyltransferase Ste14